MTSVILSPIALEDLEEICDYVILYRSHAAMKLAQQSLRACPKAS